MKKKIFLWILIILLVVLIWFVWFFIYDNIKYKKAVERYENLPYHNMIEVYSKSWTVIDDIWNIVEELWLNPVDIVEREPYEGYLSEYNIPDDTVVYEIWFEQIPYCREEDYPWGGMSYCVSKIEEYDFVYEAFDSFYISPYPEPFK